MKLAELVTDLKAAGANENTVRLAMNCYELGETTEREACAKLCDTYEENASKRHDAMANDRNKAPVLYMLGKEVAAGNLACHIRRRGQQ